MSFGRWAGVASGAPWPRSTLAVRLGGLLDRDVVGGATTSAAASEFCSIENIFVLELGRDNDELSRLLSFFVKTLVGPKVIAPPFEILPKFERSPALFVGLDGPDATAHPSGPT